MTRTYIDPSLILPLTASKNVVTDSNGKIVTSTVDASALTPLTTKGDIYTYSTTNARLAVGTNNYVLTADSAETTGLKWATVATPNEATAALTAQTNIVSSSSWYTTANDSTVHLYRLSMHLICTTAGTMSLSCGPTYYNANNASVAYAQYVDVVPSGNNGYNNANYAATMTGTQGNTASTVYTFAAYPNTEIKYVSSGSISSGQYSLYAALEKLV